MSITLSRGSLLNVFSCRRVYQPLWQIVHVYQADPPVQLVVSDGENTANCVTLKPSCHLTFNKTEWKTKNSRKKAEDVIDQCSYPILKIIEFELAQNESTSVIVLTKIKLMGFNKKGDIPQILLKDKIPLIIPKGTGYKIAMKDSCEIDNWKRPRFEFNEENEDGLESLSIYRQDAGSRSLKSRQKKVKLFTEEDLISGELAILGPKYLDVLNVCGKCKLLNYQTSSKTGSFVPQSKNFLKELGTLEILPDEELLQFCSCENEDEKFREEFQSKCVVVNQETGNSGKSSKVQCILIGKNSEECKEDKPVPRKQINGMNRLRSIKRETVGEYDYILPVHEPRSVKYSNKPTVCERCGEEDINMASCRLCQKVFYCSAACKRADVKDHASVCRAYITVRRYKEEKCKFAAALLEPEDGCGTCGFWRDSLKPCVDCKQVFFCSGHCEEKGKENHRNVCNAYKLIKEYMIRLSNSRASEMD